MTIIEWFDIKNIEHIKAYHYMGKTGQWPEGFIPDDIEFVTNWNMILMSKMSDAYVKGFIWSEDYDILKKNFIALRNIRNSP